MNLVDQYKILIGAYYGMMELDSYITKEYVLEDLKKLIKDFEKENELDFEEIKEKYLKRINLKTKLQDLLLVLNKIDGPMDLIIMVKQKLSDLG